MGRTDADDPLLPGHADPKNQYSETNSLKRRKHSGSGVPHEEIHQSDPEKNGVEAPNFPESILDNKVNFKQVLLFLAAYLGVGALCFCLVSNQIDGKKTNGILDAVYFCIVTMTTVGYGDLVPDSKMAKLLACIYVFSGMAFVGFVLSNAADSFLEKQEVVLVKAVHMRRNFTQDEILREVETKKLKYKFLTAFALLVVLMIIGILFLYKIEKLDLFDSFYCVCATITTLGYGDKSFSTKAGRIFATFWILVSTICLAQFFYYLVELYTERRRKSMVHWVLTRKMTMYDLEAADLDQDKTLSAAEFIVYKLKELGKITDEDVSLVMEIFNALDVDHSGTITESDLRPV